MFFILAFFSLLSLVFFTFNAVVNKSKWDFFIYVRRVFYLHKLNFTRIYFVILFSRLYYSFCFTFCLWFCWIWCDFVFILKKFFVDKKSFDQLRFFLLHIEFIFYSSVPARWWLFLHFNKRTLFKCFWAKLFFMVLFCCRRILCVPTLDANSLIYLQCNNFNVPQHPKTNE